MSGRQVPPAFQEIEKNKTLALAAIIEERWQKPARTLLVVGCGSGAEAGVLARRLHVDAIGVDIGTDFAFDHESAAPAKLQVMDAHALAFPDESFDFVYSFHALEHMTDPALALRQMSRVLKKGGTFVVGTPNKARCVGYLGSATSIANKLKWNLADWRMRLTGRWRNDAGAHAGFTESELLSMSRSAFGGSAASVTDHYYSRLYGKGFVANLKRFGLSRILYPAVYIMGSRGLSAAS